MCLDIGWRRRTLKIAAASVSASTVLCVCRISLVNHSKDLLHVLVDHIGDADSRNNFEEVGRDASVQTWHTFMRYDVFELTHHGQLGFTLSNGLCLHASPDESEGI